MLTHQWYENHMCPKLNLLIVLPISYCFALSSVIGILNTCPKLDLSIVLPRYLLLRLLISGINIKHVSQNKSRDIITEIFTATLAYQCGKKRTRVPN